MTVENPLKVINYSSSEGDEMKIAIENGKCHFMDDLYEWGRCFHNGNRFSCNIAGTRKFENVFEAFEWPDSSTDEEEPLDEEDSLEKWFNRKRIKIKGHRRVLQKVQHVF